jgi:hypothetical protein
MLNAAAFNGEMKRTGLALGVVLLVMFVAMAIQEWQLRNSSVAMEFVDVACLCLFGFGAFAFLALGFR